MSAIDGASLLLPNGSERPRMSVSAYLGWVTVITGLIFTILALRNPSLIRRDEEWLGLQSPPRVSANSFYAIRVEPIFEERCVGCHGLRRSKGELRLDSFSELTYGGKHGSVVAGGELKQSELWSRITLPSTDDKVMPPDGKPRLSTDELEVIKLWIMAGASSTLPPKAIKGAPPLILEAKMPDLDEAAVVRQREPLAAAARELRVRFPNLIAYESRDSADFRIDASSLGALFGDQQLAALDPLRSHIVWMDLSDTSVTDASASSIVGFQHLRALRLSNTKVTDKLIETLGLLPAFRMLVIVGTPVGEKSLDVLRRKGVRVYDDIGFQEFIRGSL